MFSKPKLSKLFSVTSKVLVSKAPTSVPTVEAPLKMLISVANNTASTPGGQILAASTNVGKNANSPKMARTTSSPNTNAPSGIPKDRLACVISNSWMSPKGALATVVQNRISLIATYLWKVEKWVMRLFVIFVETVHADILLMMNSLFLNTSDIPRHPQGKQRRLQV